jgi:hypothetical protein
MMVERYSTSREIISTGTFALDSSDTKLCRNSRGVHYLLGSLAMSMTLRKSRSTLCASRGCSVADQENQAQAAGHLSMAARACLPQQQEDIDGSLGKLNIAP